MIRKDRSSNRSSCQARKRREKENQARPEPNLFRGRDLSNECWNQRHVSSREEAEENCERDDCCASRCWNPKGQDDDSGNVANYDENVVFSKFVACHTR